MSIRQLLAPRFFATKKRLASFFNHPDLDVPSPIEFNRPVRQASKVAESTIWPFSIFRNSPNRLRLISILLLAERPPMCDRGFNVLPVQTERQRTPAQGDHLQNGQQRLVSLSTLLFLTQIFRPSTMAHRLRLIEMVLMFLFGQRRTPQEIKQSLSAACSCKQNFSIFKANTLEICSFFEKINSFSWSRRRFGAEWSLAAGFLF